jgi:DNA repair exonuclease SbcCD ATPase subunit
MKRNTAITLTSEQAVNKTIRRAINADINDIDDLENDLDQQLKTAYPTFSKLEIYESLVNNRLEEKYEEVVRRAAAAQEEFVTIGQGSLFGDYIESHQVPKTFFEKSVAQLLEEMQRRADSIKEDWEELQRTADAKLEKWNRATHASEQVKKVYNGLKSINKNPSKVPYEEAIKEIQQAGSGSESVPGETPSKQVP